MNHLPSLLLILQGVLSSAQNTHYKRLCYVSTWAVNRPGQTAFKPEDIEATLCTHLSVAFATLDSTGTKLEPDNPADLEVYKKINAVKMRNPHLKTLLSVGGWAMGSKPFARLVANDSNMIDFSTNALNFLRDHGFDGLDVDWEYPALRGSPAGDKQRFTKLIQTLHQTFHSESHHAGMPPLLITAALAPAKVENSYEPVKLARYLDLINLMTYDLHGEWDSPLLAGHHSALYGTTADPFLNIDYMATYWANLGVPKYKLLIGLPFYGKTFSLNDTSVTGVGAAAYGPGRGGKYTHSEGSLVYFELCGLLKTGVETHMSVNQSVPYLVDKERWVGYDDEKSLQEKVKYVIDHGFGGVMVWALDLDDSSGICGKKYPLMHAVKDAFTKLVGKRQLGTPITDQGNAVAPTIKFDGGSATSFQPNFCSGKADGLYGDPSSCHFYYDCAFGQTVREPCPYGTVFHSSIYVCDYPKPDGGCN